MARLSRPQTLHAALLVNRDCQSYAPSSTAAYRRACATARWTPSARTASRLNRSPSHGYRARSSFRWRRCDPSRDGGAHAVLCLGAVIRGDTPHFDFVAGECAAGIQRVNLDTGVPVVFGVLTTDTVDQALQRSEPGPTNKGYEAAVTALEMIDTLASLAARKTMVSAS